MSEVDQIRENAAALLEGNICQSIDFRYKGCWINGAGFARVAAHIRGGRIHIEFQEIGNGTGAKAQYDDDADTLFVEHNFLLIPQLRRLLDEPTCAHELTHAVYDDMALGLQPALDSEIVAYIAEAIYGIRSGLPFPDVTNNILRSARSIAANLPTGGRVGETAAVQLCNQLLTRPIYFRQRDMSLTSGGIGRR